MKLTEREKWLMNLVFNISEGILNKDDFNSWLKKNEESIALDSSKSFPSIVKKVDPDNLPEGEVLAFNNDDQLYTGSLYLHLGKVFCYNKNITSNYELYNVTHYIEQKDLIKMISEV